MDGDTPGLGARAQEHAGHPTRRLLLLGGAAAALAVLVDHGLRVDTPQPPPPVPTRRKAPDEALVLAALGDLARLDRAQAAVLAGGDNAVVRRLRVLGGQQSRVLRGRLTNAGVPTSVIDAAVAAAAATDPATALGESRPTATAPASGTPAPSGSTSAPGPSGSPPTASVRTPAELGRLLRGSLRPDTWQALTTATTDTRELLAAAYAQRLTAAILLGTDVPAPSASPVRPELAARTAPLVYAFEVVAAQSTGDQRRAAEDTLARLTQLADDVGGTSGTLPAGWALPFPVTTPQAARRLATGTLSSAVDDAAALTRSQATAASLEDAAGWSARLQAQAVGWGLPLTAFPGASA